MVRQRPCHARRSSRRCAVLRSSRTSLSIVAANHVVYSESYRRPPEPRDDQCSVAMNGAGPRRRMRPEHLERGATLSSTRECIGGEKGFRIASLHGAVRRGFARQNLVRGCDCVALERITSRRRCDRSGPLGSLVLMADDPSARPRTARPLPNAWSDPLSPLNFAASRPTAHHTSTWRRSSGEFWHPTATPSRIQPRRHDHRAGTARVIARTARKRGLVSRFPSRPRKGGSRSGDRTAVDDEILHIPTAHAFPPC